MKIWNYKSSDAKHTREKQLHIPDNPAISDDKTEFMACLDDMPTFDVVPRSVYEQIKWERDIAMQQLEENGIAFGAKPKVGKWVYDHWCEFKCSECGYFSKSEPIRGKEKYCPNCGCKMDLKE